MLRDFSVIKILADQLKTTEFMDDFKQYIKKHFPVNLFSELKIDFVDSKKNVIVQGADFIGGSIARHFDATRKSATSNEFLKILSDRIYAIDEFPPLFSPYTIEVKEGRISEFDKLIKDHVLRNANRLILEQESSDDLNKQDQVKLFISWMVTHLTRAGCTGYADF